MPTSARWRPWFDRLALAAGLGVIGFLVSRVPLSEIARTCVGLGPLVFATPVIAFAWFVTNSLALSALCRGRVGLLDLLLNRLVGEGFNSLIPVGGIGGEPYKLRHLARHLGAGPAIAALVDDRFIENVVGLLSSAALLLIGARGFALPPALDAAIATYAILAVVIAGLAILAVLRGVAGRLGGRLLGWLGMTGAAAEPPPPRVVLRAALWCLCGRGLSLVEIGLLVHLLGLRFDPALVILLTGASAGAGFVGFAIPQGLGVTEVATTGIFAVLALPPTAGLAFALVRRGRMLLLSLVGVALYLGPGRRALRKPPIEAGQGRPGEAS